MSGAEKSRMMTLEQADRYRSPWSVGTRASLLAWIIVRLTLFRMTPKNMFRWRNNLLRMFGARITGKPYVAPSARIWSPRNLVLEDHACIGPEVEVYNLATITLRKGATVSHQAYLCGGTHDFSLPNRPLIVGSIEICEDAFVGARAFVLPGVVIGACSIVGACAVVTRDVAPAMAIAGNPARPVYPEPTR